MVEDLDAQTLQAALDSQNSLGPNSLVRFRGRVAGRFDSALVPVGPAGERRDRWWLAIEADLGIKDQVALYGHALGHGLHSLKLVRMGRKPKLDLRDGYTHSDTLAELRQLENARNAFDRDVLVEFPELARLLEAGDLPVPSSAFVSPDFLDRLAASGWRGPLVTAPYVFTEGRVYVTEGGARRGGSSGPMPCCGPRRRCRSPWSRPGGRARRPRTPNGGSRSTPAGGCDCHSPT